MFPTTNEAANSDADEDHDEWITVGTTERPDSLNPADMSYNIMQYNNNTYFPKSTAL